ncbi:hypothetical protein CALCODRAFT_242167 [Calocera cornea HHB12733]|uniref:Yeast cell wall synthesis Kre9/Knh1-like N-terminal domain-containing protein n=1 Tax=Calocera cornea HHB12733 TaxID=1353952 RepID=A0A165GPC3_9BASI|nr:hypothetical protein CALCODRAFT_242167 [Calocera cornea HHB12733]
MQLLLLAFSLLPLIRALTITAPTTGQGWTGNQTVQITWSSIAGDPATFSIELSRPNQNLGPYGGSLAVGNNVPTANGEFTFELPQVPPGDGYELQFVNISDINIVYATSGLFTVTENDTVTSTTSASSMTASTGTGTSSAVTSSSMTSGSSSSASSTSSSMTATPTSFSAAVSLISPTWLRELVATSAVLSVGIALGFGLLA